MFQNSAHVVTSRTPSTYKMCTKLKKEGLLFLVSLEHFHNILASCNWWWLQRPTWQVAMKHFPHPNPFPSPNIKSFFPSSTTHHNYFMWWFMCKLAFHFLHLFDVCDVSHLFVCAILSVWLCSSLHCMNVLLLAYYHSRLENALLLKLSIK
jgi:hypothetical protein